MGLLRSYGAQIRSLFASTGAPDSIKLKRNPAGDRRAPKAWLRRSVFEQSGVYQYPEIADIIAPISEALTSDVVTELNGRVDNDGEEPRDVAEDWLTEQGLI